jgi:serine/threonine-protein kinase
VFCPDCGTWNRGSAAACSRCNAKLPDVPDKAFEKPDEEITKLRHATGSRYRVVSRLGGGGMASVYLAEHSQLGRTVVLKVLHGHLAKDSEMLERFRREARAASQLVHPNIVPIIDAGDAEGVLFTVMPYLPGGSYADRIAKGPRPADEVASVVAQSATALDYAHRRGIVHRDVKPDNILFDEDGHAVITDFGIATARFHGRLTKTGRAMGTPHYMSPEQAMGRMVDGRSDLYAIGVMLYEMLLGFPPFDGADSYSVGYKQVHENAVAPDVVDSRIPAELSSIVMRCLAKSVDERYQTGYRLADALIAYLAAEGKGAGEDHRLAWVARRSPTSVVTTL